MIRFCFHGIWYSAPESWVAAQMEQRKSEGWLINEAAYLTFAKWAAQETLAQQEGRAA